MNVMTPCPTRRRAAVPLALALAFALTASTARAAQADDVTTAEAVAQTISAALESLGQPAPVTAAFSEDAGTHSAGTADTSVSVNDGVLALAPAGAAPLQVLMPVGTSDQAQVTKDGSVVLASDSSPFAVAVTALADGNVRVQTVVDSPAGPDSFAFPMALPEAARLVPRADGGVDVVSTDTVAASPGLSAGQADSLLPAPSDVAADPQGPAVVLPTAEELQQPLPAATAPTSLAHLPAPWAVDAAGQQLPTRFAVEGSTLVQHVDTDGATFPVVADPFFVPLVAVALGAAARALAPAAIRAFTATTIRAGVQATTRGGYSSLGAFKRAHGTKPGYDWHHIVEQRHVGRWAAEAIHHPNNLIALPARVHQACINSWMSSKNVRMFGLSTGNKTMREVVGAGSFSYQHQIGVALLRHCGVQL